MTARTLAHSHHWQLPGGSSVALNNCGTGFNIRDYAGPAAARWSGAELNFAGLIAAARCGFFGALNAFQGSERRPSDLLQPFRSAVRHVDEPKRGLKACVTQKRGELNP